MAKRPVKHVPFSMVNEQINFDDSTSRMTRLIVRSSASQPIVFSTIEVGNVALTSTSNGLKIGNVEWTLDGLHVTTLHTQSSLIGPVLTEQQTITNIVVTDNQWTPVPNVNVLESNVSDVYFFIQGTYFRPGTSVFVGTSLTDVTYVSADRLHIKAPSLDDGQYTVTVVRPDGQTSTRSIMYSAKPVWSGVSDLGYVYGSFRFQLSANSDSNVNYTSTDIPAGTILYGNGLYEGNNRSNATTVYGFTVSAVDEENQLASRDLSITYSVPEWKYTDDVWNPLTQTALDSNTSNVYWTIERIGAADVTSILVDGTPVTSFSVVSDSVLRALGPSKPRGTYDVSIVTASTTTVLPDRVFFSDVPVWVNETNGVQFANESKISTSTVTSQSMTRDGSRVVVGWSREQPDGILNAGAVYVYVRSGPGSWVQEAKLILSQTSAFFGSSCSISDDGFRLVVGATYADVGSSADLGAVYVYVRSGSSWSRRRVWLHQIQNRTCNSVGRAQ
jgi:hypothetical protein